MIEIIFIEDKVGENRSSNLDIHIEGDNPPLYEQTKLMLND